MKKVLLFAMMAGIAFTGCNKDDSTSPNNPDKTGEIRFTNTSSNKYYIYISGNSEGVVNGKSYKKITKPAGSYLLRAVQAEGYVLYPTEATVTVTLSAGGDKEFVFP